MHTVLVYFIQLPETETGATEETKMVVEVKINLRWC